MDLNLAKLWELFTDGERPQPIDPALRERLDAWLIR